MRIARRSIFSASSTLSIAIGALQMMLDRGELKDWFGSTEIWVEAAVAARRRLPVRRPHCDRRRALVPEPRSVEEPEFRRRHDPDVLCRRHPQRNLGAGADDAAIVDGLPGVHDRAGDRAARRRHYGGDVLVGRLINRVDNRLIILSGLLMTVVSLWQMTGFSLQMGMAPVITSGVLQGFGLGCTFVPLNTLALSNLPRHILTQGTALAA